MKREARLPFEPLEGEPITEREAHQLARRDDPDTSKAAAADIVEDLTELQEMCHVLMLAIGPQPHHYIIDAWRERYGPVAESTVRTRVAELCDAGFARSVGKVKVGRKDAIVWEALPRP
jgi:hypothetical protein